MESVEGSEYEVGENDTILGANAMRVVVDGEILGSKATLFGSQKATQVAEEDYVLGVDFAMVGQRNKTEGRKELGSRTLSWGTRVELSSCEGVDPHGWKTKVEKFLEFQMVRPGDKITDFHKHGRVGSKMVSLLEKEVTKLIMGKIPRGADAMF